MIKVSSLRVIPDNMPKITKENMAKLKKIIAEDKMFMKIKPIPVDMSKDNLVLKGRLRVKAIQLLGMTEIPESWVYDASNLTDDEKKELIKIDQTAYWDSVAHKWDIYWDDWVENLRKKAFGEKNDKK